MADAVKPTPSDALPPGLIRAQQVNQARQAHLTRTLGQVCQVGPMPVYRCGLCAPQALLVRQGNLDGLETYICPSCNRVWQEAPVLHHAGHVICGMLGDALKPEPVVTGPLVVPPIDDPGAGPTLPGEAPPAAGVSDPPKAPAAPVNGQAKKGKKPQGGAA